MQECWENSLQCRGYFTIFHRQFLYLLIYSRLRSWLEWNYKFGLGVISPRGSYPQHPLPEELQMIQNFSRVSFLLHPHPPPNNLNKLTWGAKTHDGSTVTMGPEGQTTFTENIQGFTYSVKCCCLCPHMRSKGPGAKNKKCERSLHRQIRALTMANYLPL